jgi:oligopeptide transport system substrate-binding protein
VRLPGYSLHPRDRPVSSPPRIRRIHTTQRLTRRQFGLAAGLAGWAAVHPALFAAQDEAAPWREGDGIRLAGPVNGPSSLDPALSRETQSNAVLQQLYRGLMSLDAHLDPVPALAERVDVAPDGLRHEFTLRPGARFHDGRVVTPADVQGSLTRALNPAIVGGNANLLAAVAYLGDISGADRLLAGTANTLEGIEITGEATVAITLSRPSPSFLARLTSVTTSIVDVEAADRNPDWHLQPNGTGPYRFDRWMPMELLVLQPAETWCNGTPVTGPLTYRLGTDALLPTNLYQSGEIDVVWSVPPNMVDLVRDPGSGFTWGEFVETSLFSTFYIAFSNQAEPLDDPHVRRAIQRAFPASRVAGVMYQGSVVAASGIVPPGLNGRPWTVEPPGVDLDAAREELGRSRYGSAGQVPPIAIHSADIGPVEALRDAVGDALGLRIEAVKVPWPDFLAGLAARRFAAYAINWTADYPDAASMLEMLFLSTSPDNGAGYANPAFDALIEESRQATGNDRLDILESANRLLVDDVAVIPLYHDVGHALVREGMAGVQVTPVGLLGFESVHASG